LRVEDIVVADNNNKEEEQSNNNPFAYNIKGLLLTKKSKDNTDVALKEVSASVMNEEEPEVKKIVINFAAATSVTTTILDENIEQLDDNNPFAHNIKGLLLTAKSKDNNDAALKEVSASVMNEKEPKVKHILINFAAATAATTTSLDENIEQLDNNDLTTSTPLDKETPSVNNNDEHTSYKSNIQSMEYALKQTKVPEIRMWASKLWEDITTDEEVDLKSSLEAAKLAIATHGPDSPEAQRAWAYLESCTGTAKIPDSKPQHSSSSVITTDLLKETAEALTVLEKFMGAIQNEKQRLLDE